ncbi:MAG: arsenosugar biosynthesis radical SAM protein ArsS, partial [Pseudomonadota bacterium]
MLDSYPLLKDISFPQVSRDRLQTLQVNLGYKCNLQCLHCHVNAGPNRTEVMSSNTIEDILSFVQVYKISQIDLTGGAPEMHPQFEEFIIKLSALNCSIIVRTNLVILNEPDYQHLIDIMVKFDVTLMASLPCYLQENVDHQRGKGTFEQSIQVLQLLNKKGYGKALDKLQLNLVFNPQGPELPAEQQQLESAYKDYLLSHFQIVFNQLLTISNQPIKRFGSMLMSKNEFSPYMDLLKTSFVEKNLEQLMCKFIISIDWQGYVYDCDFNQMLDLPIVNNQQRLHISEYHPEDNRHIPIQVAGHCYACTAGSG